MEKVFGNGVKSLRRARPFPKTSRHGKWDDYYLAFRFDYFLANCYPFASLSPQEHRLVVAGKKNKKKIPFLGEKK